MELFFSRIVVWVVVKVLSAGPGCLTDSTKLCVWGEGGGLIQSNTEAINCIQPFSPKSTTSYSAHSGRDHTTGSVDTQ